MQKPATKKLLLTVSAIIASFALLIGGGLAISSAHAAGTNAPRTLCNPKVDPKCQVGNQQNNMTKGLFTIVSIQGNQIQATYVAPQDKQGTSVTILTTASTTYQPNTSVVAVGKTITAAGTINKNGSITAQLIAFYDPTLDQQKGQQQNNMTKGLFTIVSIQGNQIQATYVAPQDKQGTSVTILTTASTTYQPNTSVVAVGKTITAAGTINKNGSITAQLIAFYDPTLGQQKGQQ